MEVKLGELAEPNGLSSEVKEFGAHMVKDQTRLNKELGAAATSIGLTVPSDLSEEQKTAFNNSIFLSSTIRIPYMRRCCFVARRQPLAHFLYFSSYPFSRFCAAFEYSKLSVHDARIDQSGDR
jgi:hypothetical protein